MVLEYQVSFGNQMENLAIHALRKGTTIIMEDKTNSSIRRIREFTP